MNYTPDMNDGRNVFVFGSNLAGVHGAGAAKEAHKHWGAIWGVNEGMTGNAYAIPTKDLEIQTLSLANIRVGVLRFLEYATANPERTFLVTRIGCGLAGYRDHQIAPMFTYAPSNCVLPDEWRTILEETTTK